MTRLVASNWVKKKKTKIHEFSISREIEIVTEPTSDEKTCIVIFFSHIQTSHCMIESIKSSEFHQNSVSHVDVLCNQKSRNV